MTNVGSDHTRVHRKLSLEAYSQQWLYMSNGTHVEDKKDPVEIQLPSGNCVLVTLRVEKSGDSIPSTLLDDLLQDPLHSSAVQSITSEL